MKFERNDKVIIFFLNKLVFLSNKNDEYSFFFPDRMADKYHLRGGVRFIESLPKTPTGKVRRLLVREMVRNV